jgi:hypothetical protein
MGDLLRAELFEKVHLKIPLKNIKFGFQARV